MRHRQLRVVGFWPYAGQAARLARQRHRHRAEREQKRRSERGRRAFEVIRQPHEENTYSHNQKEIIGRSDRSQALIPIRVFDGESQVSALFLEPRIVGTSIDTCQKDECPNALPLAVISESRRVDHAPRIKGWRCLWQLLTRSVTAGTSLLPIFLQKALWTNRLLIISA